MKIPASTLHASRLRSLFHVALASGGACTLLLGACSGTVVVDGSDGGADAAMDTSSGESAIVEAGRDTSLPDTCHVAVGEPTPSCGDYARTIEGDPTTCGFDGGAAGRETCTALCSTSGFFLGSCSFSAGMVICHPSCPVDGRRPPGKLAVPAASGDDLGSHFARMAYFEEASVHAFVVLERELREHGAPVSLLRSLHRAADDERRHASMAAALARKHGSEVSTPRYEALPHRTLEEIACDNALEGCGRETLGALIGLHQSRHAQRRDVRRFYATIARDETRHAAVSWRMQRWILARLDDGSRARVARLFRRSREPVALAIDCPHALRSIIGLPDDAGLRRLATAWRDVLAAA
jgi:hypothetical protein